MQSSLPGSGGVGWFLMSKASGGWWDAWSLGGFAKRTLEGSLLVKPMLNRRI